MNRLVIIGAAELGSLIHSLADQTEEYEVVGYYDDRFSKSSFNDKPVLGQTDDLIKDHAAKKFDSIIIAVGYNHMSVRKKLFDELNGKIPFATIIHRSVYLDKSVKVGQGSVIFPGCVIDQHVVIGNNVLFNTAVSISHHSSVGDHCFLAPRVAIAGRVTIEQSCFIGIGTIIKDMITVKNNCVIGAGSLVLKDLESYKLAYGAPANVISDI